MKLKKKILVILGGSSREREVSLESGKACILALKKIGYRVKKFDPNYFVDISKYINNKTQAFKIYKSEVQKTNQPRNNTNIRALSKVRGAQINTKYALSLIHI